MAEALKPQDVLVALWLSLPGAESKTTLQLAEGVGLSASQAHAASKRLEGAGLLRRRKGQLKVARSALEELLVHGVRYVFPVSKAGPTRGTPTAHAAPPLNAVVVASGDLPPVWPDPLGTVLGYSFSPIYKTAPQAARRDEQLYALLALTDALRDGRVRERALARQALETALKEYAG